MTSPLHGAASPHSCSGRTKEEVVANFSACLDRLLGQTEPTETREQRMARHAQALVNKELRQTNYEASFRPLPRANPKTTQPRYYDEYRGNSGTNYRGD